MKNGFLYPYVSYSFSSGIGSREVSDCITKYKGIVYVDDDDSSTTNEYVGEISFKIINLRQAEEQGFSMYELFDTDEYTFRHSQSFYDLFKNTFKKPVLNKFPELEYSCTNICILETIGIIPKYRGKVIGARVFKDLVWRFGHCELFILQPFPLQLEPSNPGGTLSLKLELDKFEKNPKKATDTLSKYYQSWGFEKIKGIKELLFYCTLYRNEAFDNLDLDNF